MHQAERRAENNHMAREAHEPPQLADYTLLLHSNVYIYFLVPSF